eukprot:6491889-Alexandrium_andersonii.AAC.1
MNHPAAMFVVVLNETVGRAVVAACKGGLVDSFAHRRETRARFLSPRLQKELVDSWTHFESTLQQAAGKVEQYWQVAQERGSGCVDGEVGAKSIQFFQHREVLREDDGEPVVEDSSMDSFLGD